jgi:hypothetical protein
MLSIPGKNKQFVLEHTFNPFAEYNNLLSMERVKTRE